MYVNALQTHEGYRPQKFITSGANHMIIVKITPKKCALQTRGAHHLNNAVTTDPTTVIIRLAKKKHAYKLFSIDLRYLYSILNWIDLIAIN